MPDLEKGLNPATWMLQISSTGMEVSLGIDFADIYKASSRFTCVAVLYHGLLGLHFRLQGTGYCHRNTNVSRLDPSWPQHNDGEGCERFVMGADRNCS